MVAERIMDGPDAEAWCREMTEAIAPARGRLDVGIAGSKRRDLEYAQLDAFNAEPEGRLSE